MLTIMMTIVTTMGRTRFLRTERASAFAVRHRFVLMAVSALGENTGSVVCVQGCTESGVIEYLARNSIAAVGALEHA